MLAHSGLTPSIKHTNNELGVKEYLKITRLSLNKKNSSTCIMGCDFTVQPASQNVISM